MKRRTRADKAHLYRVKFQTELWPAVAQARGYQLRDEVTRRDLRAQCWEQVGVPHLGESMPTTDAEFTALATYCRHLADPENITLSMAWDNCRADYIAFNKSRQADHHQSHSSHYSRRSYRDRPTAASNPLDKPLTRKEATHRLIKMRASAKANHEPADDLCPF